MKKIINKLLPFAFILLVTCLIFFKIFLKGLYPIPGDLLVSFYFPYYSGGWDGYNPWTTHKELLSADSIRQIYLWKEFALNQFKLGKVPLWNPYTFSGQPLLANFQSSVFYPFNIFYFLTNAQNAWILLIVVQPLLGGIFMYILLKNFKISTISSLFGSITFIFSSYFITWMENGNITHSYIWLPLVIYSVSKYFSTNKIRYPVLMSLFLAISILGGHPQTVIYIYLTLALFWIYQLYIQKKDVLKSMLVLALSLIASFLISAIQLFPTAALYSISPISLPFSRQIFDRSILPYHNLITFFASDFFGHPANNNFWSQTYGDFTPYIGVVPLIFCLWAIFKLWSNKFTKFLSAVSLLFILAAVHGPITYLIKVFKIPLLDATSPARFISVSIFAMAILAALGLQDFLKNTLDKTYFKKFLLFSLLIGSIYLGMWIFALVGANVLLPKDVWEINLAVTKRNLILPTLMFVSIPALSIFAFLLNKKTIHKVWETILVISIFAVTLVGGIYYTNKYLPAAPKNYIFPDHPLFTWLEKNAGINRVYGVDTAHIDANFPIHYHLYSAEGYDTLRIGRYAELMASSFKGTVPQRFLRSDASFPNTENGYRKRLFDLLGVKYLLDKVDDPKTGADWHYERFNGDTVKGYWQWNKFQVYLRPSALPRIFQTTNYITANDKTIIKDIYDPNFNLKTLILEEKPPLKIIPSSLPVFEPKINNYSPGKIAVSTSYPQNSLVFVSDAYDPSWQVTVDGKKTKLLRTDYALMSAAVPKGSHLLTFEYKPVSFTLGLYTTIFALLILAFVTWYLIHKNRF